MYIQNNPTANQPTAEDDAEKIIVKNVVHCLAGHPVDTSLSALIKVMESLLVGSARSKGASIKFVAKISSHLKKELNAKDDKEFGYLYEGVTSNDPILADKKGG